MADGENFGNETVDSLANRIKAKYPDYANADNHDLVSRVIKKYPEYQARLSTQELQNIAAQPSGSPWERFKSGVSSGWEALKPQLTPENPFSVSGITHAIDTATGAGIPRAIGGAYEGYKQARESGQGVIPSIASAAGGMAGLNAPSIARRASANDIAGVAGEGVPLIASTLIGGELGEHLPKVVEKVGGIPDAYGAAKDVAGDLAHGYLRRKVGSRAADKLFPEKATPAPEPVLPPNASVSTTARPGAAMPAPSGRGATTSTGGMPINMNLPAAPDPVAAAVRARTASWVPKTMPKPPGEPPGGGVGAIPPLTPEESIKSGRLPDVLHVPEPTEPAVGGEQWSVPREKLGPLALRGNEGAQTVLQRLGQPQIVIPRGAAYDFPIQQAGPSAKLPQVEPFRSTPRAAIPPAPAVEQPRLPIAAVPEAPREAPAAAKPASLSPLEAIDKQLKDVSDQIAVENRPARLQKLIKKGQELSKRRETIASTGGTSAAKAPKETFPEHSPEVMDAAEHELKAALHLWDSMPAPERFRMDYDTENFPLKPSEQSWGGVGSPRPDVESAFPWVKNMPGGLSELKKAIGTKGLIYKRWREAAAQHIEKNPKDYLERQPGED